MMTACNKCDSQEAIFKCSKCGKVMLNSKEKMSAYLGEFISKSVIMEINSSKRYEKAGQLQDRTWPSGHLKII